MLEALREGGATATFFMIGERVQATPEVARAVISAGSEVQLHCHRHLRHSELTESEIEADARAALGVFARIGVYPTHWRTPWGTRTPATERVARRHRLTLVNWTIDTYDWRGDAAIEMLARLIGQLGEGSVILMHDALGPGALRAGCEETVELLALLLAAARSQGLSALPLASRSPARLPMAGVNAGSARLASGPR